MQQWQFNKKTHCDRRLKAKQRTWSVSIKIDAKQLIVDNVKHKSTASKDYTCTAHCTQAAKRN